MLTWLRRLLGIDTFSHRRHVADLSRDEAAELVKRARESGERYTADYLLDVFKKWWPDPLAQEAAEALVGLVSKANPYEWTRFYEGFRYLKMTREDVGNAAEVTGPAAIHLLGLASLNSSGYVREAAVKQLAATGSSAALPYVLLRLPDWVKQVRSAAQEALDTLLGPESAADIIKYYPIIEHLQRVERVDLSSVRKRTTDILLSSGGRPAVLAALDSSDGKQRRFVYRLLEPHLEEMPDVLDKSIGDASVAVRIWALRNAMRGNHEKIVARLRSFVSDRDSRVRTMALRVVAQGYWDEFETELRNAMFDIGGNVRWAAAYYLRKNGETDLAGVCRRKLAESDIPPPGLLLGLSETGTPEDFELVEPYAKHARTKLRAAAISALGRLDKEKAAPYALQGLRDNSGKVRRAATAVLGKCAPGTHLSEIREVIREGSPKVKTSALQLLAGAGRWNVLADILEAVIDRNEDVAWAGWKALSRWSAEVWHAASPEDVARAKALLPKAVHKDPPVLANVRVSWDNLKSKLDQLPS